ncbi:MAG: carboxypeptidase-like regulatory domain-containing protein [Mangrovibacterium sp.]
MIFFLNDCLSTPKTKQAQQKTILKSAKEELKISYLSTLSVIVFTTFVAMRKILLLFTLLLGVLMPWQSMAQHDEIIIDPVLVFFKGRLVDKLTGDPVPFANVVNLRTRGGTSTNISGYFSMEMLNVDTMLISVLGYEKERISIRLPYSEDSTQVYAVEPIRFPIQPVEVEGKKREMSFGDLGTGKVDSLSPEFRATTWKEKPKWWQVLFNPIKYAEYKGKGETKRREMREALATEADWLRLTKYYNQEMVFQLTGLKEEDADDFMIYFNLHNKLTGRSNEYDVREAILRLYGEYMKQKYGESYEL